jgi:Holliday junction resolvase RusA-like endonuclease
MNDMPLMSGAIRMTLTFALNRPHGHWSVKGELKASAPRSPSGRPDLDKLIRAALDALTGVVYRDDAQIVMLYARKVYAGFDEGERLDVDLSEL